MTINLTLEYIARRMKELGSGDDFSIQFRQLVWRSKGKLKQAAGNQLFILLEPSESIAVKSDSGVFDVTTENVNELHYEHRGEIRIRNYTIITQHARFIQVIPNETKPCP